MAKPAIRELFYSISPRHQPVIDELAERVEAVLRLHARAKDEQYACVHCLTFALPNAARAGGGVMTEQGAEKLKELKRTRRVLDGATVTMIFDLIVLLTDEDREATKRLVAMNAGIERARRPRRG